MIRLLVGTIAIAMLLSPLGGAAQAQEPPRTIKIVVPFPAGGSADTLTRVLAEHIGKTSGRSVVIENRPGAGTVIANEAIARANPDGSTLLVVANSFIINRHLRPVTYHPLTNFTPICLLVTSPQLVAVNAGAPYKTLGELVAAAKAKPGELTIAANGPGTIQHLAAELLKRATGTSMTYVPYPGGNPAINALLGSHVTTVVANYVEFAPQLSAGKLRPLATTSAKRIDPLPDLPTVTELGYPLEATAWFGIAAPARTPPQVVDAIGAWFVAALNAPEVRPVLTTQGLYPVGTCGAQFAGFLRAEFEASEKTVRDAGIKAD